MHEIVRAVLVTHGPPATGDFSRQLPGLIAVAHAQDPKSRAWAVNATADVKLHPDVFDRYAPLVLLVLLQATHAAPQAHDPWTAAVALGLGILSMVTTIVTAALRRSSGARVAALAKQAADIGKTLGEHGQKLGEHTTRLDEQDEQIASLEAWINETDPNLKTRDARLEKLEGEIAEDRAERVRRREEQHKSDLVLTGTLTEIGTNLKNLKERIEEQTHVRRR